MGTVAHGLMAANVTDRTLVAVAHLFIAVGLALRWSNNDASIVPLLIGHGCLLFFFSLTSNRNLNMAWGQVGMMLLYISGNMLGWVQVLVFGALASYYLNSFTHPGGATLICALYAASMIVAFVKRT